MILTPLWILVRFCRRRLFTPSFVCLFVCLSQLALREVSVMLYNIARQVLITSKNEDNFKNEDNLKTEDSLKMKKTSKLRLSIISKRPKKWWQPKNEEDLKKEDNLKNQDEDLKEGCTYWAYTTTFVVLVSPSSTDFFMYLNFQFAVSSQNGSVVFWLKWRPLWHLHCVFIKTLPKNGEQGERAPGTPKDFPRNTQGKIISKRFQSTFS